MERVWKVLPHEQDLRSWVRARFTAVRDVDDLVQEAYVRLLKARQSGPIANPRAFLFVVVRNLALNHLRHLIYEFPEETGTRDALSIAEELSTPADSAVQEEELELLIKAIQSLPKRCRQVMTLRKIYGLSQREAAQSLGISVSTVEAQVSIGIRKCVSYFRQGGYLKD